jgi:plastocyanin
MHVRDVGLSRASDDAAWNYATRHGHVIVYPVYGLLLSAMVASAAVTVSTVSLIANALRLAAWRCQFHPEQRPARPRTRRDMKRYSVLISVLVSTTICFTAVIEAWGGTIKGSVRYSGSPAEPRKLPVTADQYICGKEKDAEDLVFSPEKGIRNVVVSLQAAPAGARWEGLPPPAQMDQKQCMFVPRVVIVPVGGTVEFLNNDRLLHNLHSRDAVENPRFNRTQPKGRTIPIAFRKPEIVRVDCDLHPWMRAWVVVAEHPFYAVTNDRGEFVLENVPPGTYTLQVWHESLGAVKKDVAVSDGVTAVTVEMARK